MSGELNFCVASGSPSLEMQGRVGIDAALKVGVGATKIGIDAFDAMCCPSRRILSTLLSTKKEPQDVEGGHGVDDDCAFNLSTSS